MTAQPLTGDGSGSSGGPRGRNWLLIGSLMLNLLVVGAVGHGLWRAYAHDGHHGHHGGQMGGAEKGLMGYVRQQLPPARREVILDGNAEAHAKLRAQRHEMEEAQRGMLDAVALEPFDAGALERAMQHAGEVEAKLHEIMRAQVIAAAGRMTPEERKGYRDWRLSLMHQPNEDAAKGGARRP